MLNERQAADDQRIAGGPQRVGLAGTGVKDLQRGKHPGAVPELPEDIAPLVSPVVPQMLDSHTGRNPARERRSQTKVSFSGAMLKRADYGCDIVVRLKGKR